MYSFVEPYSSMNPQGLRYADFGPFLLRADGDTRYTQDTTPYFACAGGRALY